MTLEHYYQRHEEIRLRDTTAWNATFQKPCPHCQHIMDATEDDVKAFEVLRKKCDDERIALKAEMLADPEVAGQVCDTEIHFQSKKHNHDTGVLLERTFPSGVNDSETGEGFFYCPSAIKDQVLAFLVGKASVHRTVPMSADFIVFPRSK